MVNGRGSGGDFGDRVVMTMGSSNRQMLDYFQYLITANIATFQQKGKKGLTGPQVNQCELHRV